MSALASLVASPGSHSLQIHITSASNLLSRRAEGRRGWVTRTGKQCPGYRHTLRGLLAHACCVSSMDGRGSTDNVKRVHPLHLRGELKGERKGESRRRAAVSCCASCSDGTSPYAQHSLPEGPPHVRLPACKGPGQGSVSCGNRCAWNSIPRRDRRHGSQLHGPRAHPPACRLAGRQTV